LGSRAPQYSRLAQLLARISTNAAPDGLILWPGYERGDTVSSAESFATGHPIFDSVLAGRKSGIHRIIRPDPGRIA